MARPVKKSPEQWTSEILAAAKTLFLSKGYEQTSISDIMEAVGGAKGTFYHCFGSKEGIMNELGDRMFLDNNPFEAVRERTDLNGMQKIRELLRLDRSDNERESINAQALPILDDPRILAAAIDSNRRILTPLWFELLEQGRQDGSIQTKYTKELSELLPLINFWFMPQLFPATEQELHHKLDFLTEVLTQLGLPLYDGETLAKVEKRLADLSISKGEN